MEQPQVPLRLAAAEGRIFIAGVVDQDIGKPDRVTGPPYPHQDLFVDAVLPPYRRVVAEQAHLIDDRGRAAERSGQDRCFMT